jgi:D-ribose pyranose/furanose isomerase RbsD
VIILVYNILDWKWIYGNNDDDLYQGIYYLVQTFSTILQNMFLRNNITANNIKSGNDRVSTVLMSLYTR